MSEFDSQPAHQSVPLNGTLAPHPDMHRPQAPKRRGLDPRIPTWSLEEELRILDIMRSSLAAHDEALEDPDLMLVLAESETSLLEAIDAVLNFDLFDDGLISSLKACKDTLAVRLSRLEERRRSRRAILEQCLMMLERKVLERPTATITLAERPPALVVVEEARIPARFFDLKPTLNRRLAKEALLAGEDVPGALLSDRTLTLTVRRR